MRKALDLVYKVILVILITLAFVTCLNMLNFWDDEVTVNNLPEVITVCDQRDSSGRKTCRRVHTRTDNIVKIY